MATTNLGRIALVPKGDWVSGATYKKLDVVRFGTASFICLNLTTVDPTNTTDWQLLASDGPQGDVGAGASNFTTQTKIFNFVGSLVPTVGTAKFYPPQTITVTSLYVAIGTQALEPITVVVKKNNTPAATAVLPANSNRTLPQAVSVVVTSSDYLTVDIPSAMSGANLNLTLVYS